MNKKYKKIFSIIAGFIVAIIFALPYIIFKDELKQFSVLGYFGLFFSCLISNISILLPSSSTLIVVIASSALNPWLCIIVGGLGAAIGEQASYLCGFVSSVGNNNKNKFLNRKALKWFANNPFFTIFVFAVAPLPIFDIVGIIAGNNRMVWWEYTLAAFLGKVLKFAFVIVGIFYFFPLIAQKTHNPFIQEIIEKVNDIISNK